jgi:predicted nucleotidyltransferase
MGEPEIYDIGDPKFPRPNFELLGVPNEWLVEIRQWASAKPRIEAIYLFGSRAKLTHRPDSDIDLALLFTFNENDTDAGYWICTADTIRDELSGFLPVKPHVFPLNYQKDEYVTPAVYEHGIRIYLKQP